VNNESQNSITDDLLMIIPVRNVVIFPGAVSHISIGREMSVVAAEQAVAEERRLGLLLQHDPAMDEPRAEPALLRGLM